MRFRLFPVFVFVVSCLIAPAAAGQASATWQQRVRYEMDVRLFADRHRMEGRQRLTYTNHSPDTLRRVFYHLYFNAFDPGSMMAQRNRELPDPDGRVVPRIFELGPGEVGWHRVRTLTQDGRAVEHRVDDTVLSVDLATPLLPGASTVFEMTFESQVPLQTRRNGRDNREGVDYSMAQWYPKLAAYDARGWHADPYVGREFYAPFGTFDVRLTLPADFVVGATGVLQNPDAIGHGYQQDTTRTYTYDPTDSLTWHFVAENVHDFAWVADTEYLHDQFTDGTGVTYHTLYLPEVAASWQHMRRIMPALFQYYGTVIGPYAWPQFTVAQAGDGGMEYPMMNFITGRRSPASLLGITAHEGVHEWFYGMLGSNESDYAWMDEGFTDYWSTEAVAAVAGQAEPSHANALLNVVSMHEYDLYEPLNTPSDWFETNAAYGISAYSGGNMIGELLGYVLSEPVRDAFFREYFRRFRFRHPNPYDVEKVAEDVSGLQLDWFFEQFLDTEGRLDHALAGLRSARSGTGWRTRLTLAREGEIVLPVDVRLTLEDGTTRWLNVPLTAMEGHKPVPDGGIVAEAWPWTSRRHTVEVELPQRVVRAEIDPLGQTPEMDRLDNAVPFPLDAAFLRVPSQQWYRYSLGYRPLALYAHNYGVGAGLQARGTYLFGDHQLRAMLTLWPQLLASGGDEPDAGLGTDSPRSALEGIDYEFSYARNVRALGPFASAGVTARKHLGILENTLSVTKQFGRFAAIRPTERRLSLSLTHQYQPWSRSFEIDAFPFFISDHTVWGRLAYRASRGADRVEVGAEVGGSVENLIECTFPEGDPGYCPDFRQSANHVFVEAQKTAGFGPFEGRAQFKLGFGAENLAFHKRFRLGAASAEEAWRNDAYRQLASPMEELIDEAKWETRFDAFDGPGPVAYLLSDLDPRPGETTSRAPVGRTPLGTSVAAGTLALSTGPLARRGLLQPLSLEAFSGVGTVWGLSGHARRFSFDSLVADAGVGLSFDLGALTPLQRWTAQSDVLSGLHLAVKLPFWVSDPDLLGDDEDAFAFRWLVGVTLD